jgi:hypothetical protein
MIDGDNASAPLRASLRPNLFPLAATALLVKMQGPDCWTVSPQSTRMYREGALAPLCGVANTHTPSTTRAFFRATYAAVHLRLRLTLSYWSTGLVCSICRTFSVFPRYGAPRCSCAIAPARD